MRYAVAVTRTPVIRPTVMRPAVSGYESTATWFKVGGVDSQRLMVTIWTTGVEDRGVGIVEGLVVDG